MYFYIGSFTFWIKIYLTYFYGFQRLLYIQSYFFPLFFYVILFLACSCFYFNLVIWFLIYFYLLCCITMCFYLIFVLFDLLYVLLSPFCFYVLLCILIFVLPFLLCTFLSIYLHVFLWFLKYPIIFSYLNVI